MTRWKRYIKMHTMSFTDKVVDVGLLLAISWKRIKIVHNFMQNICPMKLKMPTVTLFQYWGCSPKMFYTFWQLNLMKTIKYNSIIICFTMNVCSALKALKKVINQNPWLFESYLIDTYEPQLKLCLIQGPI